MILADKIIDLRKKNGWSQEELAEKLGVSRQAVSKWESAQAIPDLGRVLAMADLFSVTTDYLLRDENEAPTPAAVEDSAPDSSVRRVSMEEASAFLALCRKQAPTRALAVSLCVLSPIPLLMILSRTGEGPAAGVGSIIGVVILLLLVVAAVVIFLRQGMESKEYEYLEQEDIETAYGVSGMVFDVYQGEILGIVGESGCGKSVTSQSIMRLYDERRLVRYSGTVKLEGQSLLDIPFHKMQDIRGSRVSMIFQDALSSLNPVLTICDQISEPLRIHQHLSKKAAREKALEMLRLVGIPAPEKRLDQYPHELSGGMRQRVMIAIALACRPHLLIADEPTTALDVTIQAQIMELIVRLNEQLNMGVMLITHDLAVVAQTCSRVIVMYLGQIVEEADVLTLFDHPCHPYTEGLMRSIPRMEGDRTKPLYMIPGTVPLLSQIPTGCRFAPRCAYATERCRQETPQLTPVSDKQSVRCFRAAELAQKEANAQ